MRIVAVNSTKSDLVTSNEARFSEDADELDRVRGVNRLCNQLYTCLVAFTTEDSNREVRNARNGSGLQTWRRLHTAYDPASSPRRVAILGRLQNPTRGTRWMALPMLSASVLR